MKIIAAIDKDRFLVEMHEDEIAKAVGYSSTWSSEFEKLNGGRAIRVGTRFEVSAAYNYHERIMTHQKEAASAANTLRALADLIGGAMPSVVIPPIAENPPEEPSI